MADGLFSFLRQDPNQMPQRTFMQRLGSAAAILNPMNPMSAQYGQMMDARLQQRRQEYTRNRSIEELQRRAQGGDKLAERYLGAVQSGALQPGQAFSAYYQQMASEDQFRRQQAAVAGREQAKLQRQADQASKIAEYLRSKNRNDLADMVLAYPQMANNILQSIASTQLQPAGFRVATPEEAAQYGAEAGQFDAENRFYPTQKIEKTQALTSSEQSKAQNALLAYQSITPTINEYKRLVDEGGLGLIPGTQQDVLKQTQTNLMLQMKELFNLGVLNGPDLDLMEKMVYDVTSPTNYATSVIGGQDPKQRFKTNLDNLERQLELLARPKVMALQNVFNIGQQNAGGGSAGGFSVTGTVGSDG